VCLLFQAKILHPIFSTSKRPNSTQPMGKEGQLLLYDELASTLASIYSLLLLDDIRVPPCISNAFGCAENAEGPMQQVEVQRKCCAMTKSVSRKHKYYECASKVFRVSTMAIYVGHSAGK
jgi:hypothetical protein